MIIGIDLGTTNSAAAFFRDGEPQLIPNALGDFLTPSAVSLGDNGEFLIGVAARERQVHVPDKTATAFKRFMGTDKKITLGRKSFRAEELSAMVLRQIKEDAERHLGVTVTGAVITVPAYFNDKQRRATRRAGELAGLTVERLINEPTAAALAFGIHKRDLEEPFLVFDLGGGTFDVSLVEMFDGIIEVRASAGDNRLGGEDFNEALIDYARVKLPESIGDPTRDTALYERMRDAAERARRALSQSDEAVMRFTWQGEQHEIPLTADDFADAAAPLIERLRAPVLRSLRDGSTRAADVSEIVLVGGSTRMPLIRKAVTKLFGRFPSSAVHPDHAVALGAAIQAGLRAKDSDLDEIRLTDVCPFTLGTGVNDRSPINGQSIGQKFQPIIERNTVLPASRVQYFANATENQKEVEFNVYQGESRQLEDNILLGSLNVPIPPGPENSVHIECRFTYDTSGLLEVDVHIPQTGVKRQVVIYDKSDGELTRNLDAKRAELEKLKIHPRDEATNAAVMARANRCYEDQLGQMREYVGGLIAQFIAALDSQDPRTIDAARDELHKRLDEVEGERFL